MPPGVHCSAFVCQPLGADVWLSFARIMLICWLLFWCLGLGLCVALNSKETWVINQLESTTQGQSNLNGFWHQTNLLMEPSEYVAFFFFLCFLLKTHRNQVWGVLFLNSFDKYLRFFSYHLSNLIKKTISLPTTLLTACVWGFPSSHNQFWH